MTRLLAIAVGLLALIGCQDPFGADRHDLVDDRVAALISDPPGALSGQWVRVRAALSVQGRPWSDEAVDLRWSWLDHPSDIAHRPLDAPAHAVGPAPVLRVPPGEGPAVIGVLARFPGGFVERATLEIQRVATPAAPRIIDLGASARTVAPDGTIGLEVTVDRFTEPRMRWMTGEGRGTFVETSGASADWFAADIEFDDGDEEEREPLEEGPVTVVALAVSADQGNALRAENLWVGTPPVGVWLDDGRWLSADEPLEPGTWSVTLVADDAAPWGLGVADAVLVSGPPTLDLDDLLYGRVQRRDLVGQSVTIEVAP